MHKEKALIRIKYYAGTPHHVKDRDQRVLQQAFLHKTPSVFFYNIFSKYFKVIYEPLDADIVFEVYHYNSQIDSKSINIIYMPEAFIPNFNLYDYGIGFDDMSFDDRYVRFPYWMLTYQHNIDIAHSRVHDIPAISYEEAHTLLQSKTQFCSFVVSNQTLSTSERTDFFYLLSTYKQVSSGGRVLNNIGKTIANKHAFQRASKFAIVFENTSRKNYVTEKLIDALESYTIPIYWGSPTVGEEFNTDAFINCHDYNSFEEVIEKIKEIDNNDELWCNMVCTPNKINITKAQHTLKSLEQFLYNIGIKAQTRSKKVHAIDSDVSEALKLKLLKSKYNLPISSLEKIIAFYNAYT